MNTSVPPHAPAARLRDIARAFWPYAAPRRLGMLAALALAVAGPLFTAAEIWLFKIVVDDILVPRDFAPSPWSPLTYLGLTLAAGADRRRRPDALDLAHASGSSSTFGRPCSATSGRCRSTSSPAAGWATCWPGSPATCPPSRSFLVSGEHARCAYLLELVVFTAALFWLQPTLALVSLFVTPLFWVSSRLLLPPAQGRLPRAPAPLGLDQHLDRADARHHAAGAGLRPGRARGRPVRRGGGGQVPRRDGVGAAAFALRPHRRPDRADRRARRHRRGRVAAVPRAA